MRAQMGCRKSVAQARRSAYQAFVLPASSVSVKMVLFRLASTCTTPDCIGGAVAGRATGGLRCGACLLPCCCAPVAKLQRCCAGDAAALNGRGCRSCAAAPTGCVGLLKTSAAPELAVRRLYMALSDSRGAALVLVAPAATLHDGAAACSRMLSPRLRLRRPVLMLRLIVGPSLSRFCFEIYRSASSGASGSLQPAQQRCGGNASLMQLCQPLRSASTTLENV